jgi:integrase
MPAKPGKRQRAKPVQRVEPKRGRRPKLPEIEPLFQTYDAVKPPGTHFDEKAANRVVKWIENLRHFKGRWAGQPFYLMQWQGRLIRQLFAWKRPDGTWLYRSCYAAVAAAGVRDDVVFHDLRHTFGTRMAAAGVPLRTLQEWLGHRDYKTTLIYADYMPDDRHEAELVERGFDGSPPLSVRA